MTVIDLAVIAENFRILQGTVHANAFVCPMVKANAYGHGDAAIAKKLRLVGAVHLGVGLIEEGLHLRKSGDSGSVLHFGMFDSYGAETMLEYRITPVLSSREGLENWVTAIGRLRANGTLQSPVDMHLKVNTGMNRLGLAMRDVSSIAKRMAELTQSGLIRLSGLATHFANGEDFGEAGARSSDQLILFRQAEKELRSAGLQAFQLHIANSSAAAVIGSLRKTDSSYDDLGIRPGLSLYGVEPESNSGATLGVKPALRFLSRIVHVQDVRRGEGVSYGLRWAASRDSRIGIIPCGYADGYRRGISNSSVLVAGRRVPVVGTICMDYFMCDLTEVESAKNGDLVTLIGTDGTVSVTASELAERVQTIPYEIFTGISERVPRVYNDGAT